MLSGHEAPLLAASPHWDRRHEQGPIRLKNNSRTLFCPIAMPLYSPTLSLWLLLPAPDKQGLISKHSCSHCPAFLDIQAPLVPRPDLEGPRVSVGG